MNTAEFLDGIFADEWVKDLAKSIPYTEDRKQATTAQEGIAGSLAEMLHLHEGFQRLIGHHGRERGEATPIMSYFVAFVDTNGRTADRNAKALAKQMTDSRPYEAKHVSQEALHTLLIELATLDHWLNTEGAESAFNELNRRRHHQMENAIPASVWNGAAKRNFLEPDPMQFMFLQNSVHAHYQRLQKVIGVAIPPEEVTALIEHPLTARLATMDIEEIRHQFVKFELSPSLEGSFLGKLLLQPGADQSTLSLNRSNRR